MYMVVALLIWAAWVTKNGTVTGNRLHKPEAAPVTNDTRSRWSRPCGEAAGSSFQGLQCAVYPLPPPVLRPTSNAWSQRPTQLLPVDPIVPGHDQGAPAPDSPIPLPVSSLRQTAPGTHA